jgi:hypothetical protein
MPFQLDKKNLFIGEVIFLFIIVIIVVIMTRSNRSNICEKNYIYFIRDNTYLNTTNLQMVNDKADASVVCLDPNSKILSNADQSKLIIEGVQVQASNGSNPYLINVPGGTAYRTVLNVYGQIGALFPVVQNTSVLGAAQTYNIPNALFDPSYTFALIKA